MKSPTVVTILNLLSNFISILPAPENGCAAKQFRAKTPLSSQSKSAPRPIGTPSHDTGQSGPECSVFFLEIEENTFVVDDLTEAYRPKRKLRLS